MQIASDSAVPGCSVVSARVSAPDPWAFLVTLLTLLPSVLVSFSAERSRVESMMATNSRRLIYARSLPSATEIELRPHDSNGKDWLMRPDWSHVQP